MLESLYKNVTGRKACNAGKIFKTTYFYKQQYLHVALFTVHGKEIANEA